MRNPHPIRLGIIGAGFTGRQAALAASQLPSRINSVAMADLNTDRLQPVIDEFSIPKAYHDYRELLEDKTIEAVYLGVPPNIRLKMVIDSLSAGKHVMVQKPHAIRAPEILKMEAAAQRAKKVIQFSYYLRHYPQNRSVRAAIKSGKIGRPYHGRYFSKNARPVNSNADADRWLLIYGMKGGVLAQHMSDDVILLWWWMGSPAPEWAFATKHNIHPTYNGPEGPSEDYFSGILGFAEGATIQIDVTNSSHSDSPRICELHGEEGAVAGNERCGLINPNPDEKPNQAIFRLTENGYEREEITEEYDIPHTTAPAGASPFYYEIEHFAMAIAGEVMPEVNAEEAYTFMRILDALYDSAKSNEKIVIN